MKIIEKIPLRHTCEKCRTVFEADDPTDFRVILTRQENDFSGEYVNETVAITCPTCGYDNVVSSDDVWVQAILRNYE